MLIKSSYIIKHNNCCDMFVSKMYLYIRHSRAILGHSPAIIVSVEAPPLQGNTLALYRLTPLARPYEDPPIVPEQ